MGHVNKAVNQDLSLRSHVQRILVSMLTRTLNARGYPEPKHAGLRRE